MRKPHSPTARLRGEHLDDGFCAWRVGGDRQAEEVAIPLDIEIQELATLGLSRDNGTEPGLSLPPKPQHDPSRSPLDPGAEDLQRRPITELVGRSCGVERARHRLIVCLCLAHRRDGTTSSRVEVKGHFSYESSVATGRAGALGDGASPDSDTHPVSR